MSRQHFYKTYPHGLKSLFLLWVYFIGQKLITNLDFFSIDLFLQQKLFVSGSLGQHTFPTVQVKVHLPLAYNRIERTKLIYAFERWVVYRNGEDTNPFMTPIKILI